MQKDNIRVNASHNLVAPRKKILGIYIKPGKHVLLVSEMPGIISLDARGSGSPGGFSWPDLLRMPTLLVKTLSKHQTSLRLAFLLTQVHTAALLSCPG